MRPLLTICLLLALAGLTGCQPEERTVAALDMPLRVESGAQIMDVMLAVRAKLSEEDRSYFDLGSSHLIVEFDQHISARLTKEEREQALATLLDGMTPRKIIIAGMVIYQRKMQAPEVDEYAITLGDDERHRREEHMREHSQAAEQMTIEALKRYGKKG